jgi:hypothetical protein
MESEGTNKCILEGDDDDDNDDGDDDNSEDVK